MEAVVTETNGLTTGGPCTEGQGEMDAVQRQEHPQDGQKPERLRVGEGLVARSAPRRALESDSGRQRERCV